MSNAESSKACTLLTWTGFLLCLCLSFNYSIGCRDSLGCQKIMQAPDEWILGVPIAYYGVASYLILIICSMLKIWGSFRLRKSSYYIGTFICSLSTVTNFGLLTKFWVDNRSVCLACLFSAIIYLILTYLYIKLMEQKNEHYSGVTEQFTFFLGAFLAVGGFLVQHNLITHEKKIIKPISYEALVPEPHRYRGKTDAKIKIIAFTDLCCATCNRSYGELQQIYKNSYPHLSYGVRYFPNHQETTQSLSMQASLLSLCASEKGKYWEFLDEITHHNRNTVGTAKELRKLAKKYGIVKSEYLNNIQTHQHYQMIKKDLLLVKHLNLHIVPSYFLYVNGRVYLAYANNLKNILSKEPFKKWIKLK